MKASGYNRSRVFRRRAFAALLSSLLASSWHAQAHAQLPALPRSLVTEALSDPKPFSFHVADLATEDFQVDRLGGDGAVEAELERGSLRWVRTGRVLVPRAVLVLRAARADSGVVSYAGFTHPLRADASGGLRVELPVALLSHTGYPIAVALREAGSARAVRFQLRFAPRPKQRGQLIFDSSCSPFGMQLSGGALPGDSFLYVGCRLVQTDRGDHVSPTLELYLLWDHVGSEIEVEGISTPAAVDSLFGCRVAAHPGVLRLKARGQGVAIAYRIPERIHAGFLGVGLGPYLYQLKDDRVDLSAAIPLVTLYAGYAFTPSARIVYFNASALDRYGYTDQGLYVWFEEVRLLDERLSLNLLLGANVLLYRHDDRVAGRVSAPQGFELLFRDFLARNRNLTAGAFIYPKILGRSYYNLWLRWGSPQLFGEINYIDWREPHGGGRPSASRSLGLSFGTSVLRFL